MHTTRLRVRLREVVPTVLRVVDVPAASTLPELHALLQVALGWQNVHQHEFVSAEARFGAAEQDAADLDELDPLPWRPETGVLLRALGPGFGYHYDFGDGWQHDIDVLGPGREDPGCVYGEGTCPPEDCGGPQGYQALLAALADPEHPEHAEMREWAGELPEFDQAETDELVVQTAGVVPHSVRMVLELARDGVRLTPGGRLPRTFVRQVQQQRPQWAWSKRPAAREEDLLPLLTLHTILREVGLLRLANGVLAPIRAAEDDLQVLRRLRSWFAADDFRHELAGLVAATLAQHGRSDVAELVRRVLERLDPGWEAGGEPLDEGELELQISGLSAPMWALEMLERDGGDYLAGPSARTLLPWVAVLAHARRGRASV